TRSTPRSVAVTEVRLGTAVCQVGEMSKRGTTSWVSSTERCEAGLGCCSERIVCEVCVLSSGTRLGLPKSPHRRIDRPLSTRHGTVIFFSLCGRLRGESLECLECLRNRVFFTFGAAGAAGPENGVPRG